MAEGFRWGRRPLVPRSAEPFTPEKEDSTFPTAWARTEAGTAARQLILQSAMGPLLRSQVGLRVYGLEHLEGVAGPVIFFSNHTSHLDATVIMTSLPQPLAGQDRGRRRPRLLLRRVVAAGVHRVGVRRVRHRPRGRRSQGREPGARVDRRRMVARGVPRGRAVARRPHATVPARHRAAVHRGRHRRGADRHPRRLPGHAERQELAAQGQATGEGSLRRAVVPRGRRDASGVLDADDPSGGRAPRRGPVHVVGVRCTAPSAARPPRCWVPQAPSGVADWEGSRPLERRGPDKTWK